MLHDKYFRYTTTVISEQIEGMSVLYRRIILGARLATIVSPSALIHEMAHFVEIDYGRIAKTGWGLKLREIEIAGRVCKDPLTMQATERELRVCAYEANIEEKHGITKIEGTIESLDFMPDACFVPIENGEPAYGEGRRHNLEYNDIKKSQHRWRMNRLSELRKTHTYDRFLELWHERNSKLDLEGIPE